MCESTSFDCIPFGISKQGGFKRYITSVMFVRGSLLGGLIGGEDSARNTK